MALNRAEELRFHLPNTVKNGVKQEELIEDITHLAFYSGCTNAMSPIAFAKEPFEKPAASEGCQIESPRTASDLRWSIVVGPKSNGRRAWFFQIVSLRNQVRLPFFRS